MTSLSEFGLWIMSIPAALFAIVFVLLLVDWFCNRELGEVVCITFVVGFICFIVGCFL